MLFAKTARYIANRDAVQQVYWRTNGDGGRLIKYAKMCRFRAPRTAAAAALAHNVPLARRNAAQQ